jgi:hypothetical protein
MVNWKELPAHISAEHWNKSVGAASDASPFQAYAWGEYKRAAGWTVKRWGAEDEKGRVVAYLQGLRKPLPFGRSLIWAPGGPVLGVEAAAAQPAGPMMLSWLNCVRRDGVVYARWRSHLPVSPDLAQEMKNYFFRPQRSLNSGLTIQHDLVKPIDELRASWTSKHRYYAKQAQKAALEWSFGNEPSQRADFLALYGEMALAKGIKNKLFDPESVSAISGAFGGDCLILIGRQEGKPVTGCLVLICGASAFYLMAATNAAGRKISAAYAMMGQLFFILQERGVRKFDFGGIDPNSAQAGGVTHFKKGFGGQVVEYLGEWEWGASRLWRWLANLAIRLRGSSL